MNEMSEQEKLANLIRAGKNSEAESFDSADLLTQSLMQQLGRPSQQAIAQVEQEIVSSGDELDYAPISSFQSNGRVVKQNSNEPEKDIKLIGALKKVHSGLIDVFERSGLNSGVESNLVNLIESVGSCLNYIGEITPRFEPLKHLSGLEAPNMVKNANKVIETTLNCYKIGSVDEYTISDDGSKIEIVFSGKSRNIKYRAFGVVSAKSWDGSEAIDYIYTSGSGKMSVKAFEGGKWVDKTDSYVINWTLDEDDLSLNEDDLSLDKNDLILEEKDKNYLNKSAIEKSDIIMSEKISKNKEEVLSPSLNNEVNDDEDIGDFPINDG